MRNWIMKLQSIGFSALLMGVAFLSGCGGSYSGVQALAPAEQDQLVGTASDSGQFTLYRATGFAENYDTHIDPLWTVSVSAGQKVGFRWDPSTNRWDPTGPLHLVAFAGDQVRDLGPVQHRDVKYVWAGAHADVAGYFHAK